MSSRKTRELGEPAPSPPLRLAAAGSFVRPCANGRGAAYCFRLSPKQRRVIKYLYQTAEPLTHSQDRSPQSRRSYPIATSRIFAMSPRIQRARNESESRRHKRWKNDVL
jgi:hypothetical protein